MNLQARERQREAFWRSLGAGEGTTAELLALCRPLPPPVANVPLPDEPQVSFYRSLPPRGQALFQHLAEAFPQLVFLPSPGLRETQAWVAAVRRGEPNPGQRPPPLRDPEGLALRLLPTSAGTLPALVTSCREDFVRLVQLLAHRGEPTPVPESMGALLLQGINNWQRFGALRREWTDEAGPHRSWEEAWKDLSQRKELYQDRLVLACSGPYSGIVAEGVEESQWLALSLAIRLAHEATHYLTLRVFGTLGHTVAEEIVADWVGLTTACGEYPVDLAKRFLGVERAPAFRPGGRLANYRGDPPVTEKAFGFLVRAAALAVESLAHVSKGHREQVASVVVLLSSSLEELASGEVPG